MKLKIGIISPHSGPRAETSALGKLLVQRGHEVHFYVPFNREPQKRLWGDLDVRFIRTPFLPGIRYPIPTMKWISVAMKDLESNKYDIVQACDYDYLTSAIPAMSRKIPFSSRVLTSDAFPGYNWRFGVGIVDLAGMMYTNTLGKIILRAYASVVLLHEKMIPVAIGLGVPSERIAIIHNGIDFSVFRRIASQREAKEILGIDGNAKLILYVGRLSRVKGIDILLEAIRIVRTRIENINVALIGSGEEESRLSRAPANMMSGVRLIGQIPQEHLPLWYSAADVFVSPSRSEGVPNTLLEAAAVCVPTVSTDVGGTSTFIKSGFNGILVAPESPTSLANGILDILSNPDVAESLAKRAYEEVVREHSWELAVAQFEQVYFKLNQSGNWKESIQKPWL